MTAQRSMKGLRERTSEALLSSSSSSRAKRLERTDVDDGGGERAMFTRRRKEQLQERSPGPGPGPGPRWLITAERGSQVHQQHPRPVLLLLLARIQHPPGREGRTVGSDLRDMTRPTDLLDGGFQEDSGESGRDACGAAELQLWPCLSG